MTTQVGPHGPRIHLEPCGAILYLISASQSHCSIIGNRWLYINSKVCAQMVTFSEMHGGCGMTWHHLVPHGPHVTTYGATWRHLTHMAPYGSTRLPHKAPYGIICHHVTSYAMIIGHHCNHWPILATLGTIGKRMSYYSSRV